ncbi:MAG TPA: hypothetical protein VMF60_09930, partial [Acidimicrobiales bacterium]|nr:hypothetical protein [Acidimicrobiales bacterium]
PDCGGRRDPMRNVWKGLVVGGLTGVTAGVILDSRRGASSKASDWGEGLPHRATEATERLQRAGRRVRERRRQAELAGQVRHVAHGAADSEVADRLSDTGSHLRSVTREATGRAR